MKDLWERLEAWATKSGAGSLALRPGATEADIAAAEAVIGLPFPADFREHLLLHDGQESDPELNWMPGCSPLQPLHALVARWQEEREMDEDQKIVEEESDDGKHRMGLWYPKRIPIAGSQWWDGDNTYLDFDPGSKGTAGQVITFVTECDLEVLGSSFRGAVEKYVLLLEGGKLVWDGEGKDVVPAKEGSWDSNPAEQIAKMKAPGAGKPAAAPKSAAVPEPTAAPKPSAGGARRFEMASKFWEISVVGSVMSVRFGKLGTDGQQKDKKLSSPAEAAQEAEKLVREKTGKGYVEGGKPRLAAQPAPAAAKKPPAPAKKPPAPAAKKPPAPAAKKKAAPAKKKPAPAKKKPAPAKKKPAPAKKKPAPAKKKAAPVKKKAAARKR